MRNLLNIIEAAIDATTTQEPAPTKPDMAVKKPAKQVVPPSATTPATPAKPAKAPAEPKYATKDDYLHFIPQLFNALKKTGGTDHLERIEGEFPVDLINRTLKYKKDSGRLPLIRTNGISSEQLLAATKALRLTEVPLTDDQKVSSGQFAIHSFKTVSGKLFTVVVAGRKRTAIAKGAGGDLVLNRKDLTPTKLGLAGEYTNRAALVTATKKAITTKVKNKNLADALNSLVDLAHNRGAGQLTPKQLEYITPVLGMISQDFGEVLAPIALAQDNEDIVFPSGNEKLIDVTVGGKARYSVKALGGSGTSMNSLGSLLHDYELTMTDEGKKKLFQDGIKIWQSTKKEGSVTDRICLAASKNAIPEYLSYVDILGGEFHSFGELKALLKPLVKGLDYTGFLKMILPATQAGHWGINIGMPDDSKYYLGLTDKKPTPGQAGKYSYDHDPVNAAANIITYSLGKGSEFMIKRGPNKQQYKDIMNDMIQQMNCQLGHVDIDASGQLIITSKPFGNLDFDFDYHAPSHIAGNNRPGFMIVPPNKKKKPVSKMRERRGTAVMRERR
jgi:hypothetical protein